MWDLPGPGLEPVSLALAGGFLTTAPPGKPKPNKLFFSFFFLKEFLYFYYLFLAVLGLRFCARAFSSCGKRGPFFIAVRGPLTIAASLVVEHRLQTRRLSSCGSRAQLLVACGIFPDQDSNPCALHWQADSQPLRHQGSPQ